MKTLSIIITLLITQATIAQEYLDTIYANENMNVALFFPKPIRQGITGTNDVVFTYNKEIEQYFGLLQATPGRESNLLTITNDGSIYSYVLKYKETLPKLNYFIKQHHSIGNEKPVVDTSILVKKKVNKYEHQITFFQNFSNYLLRSKIEVIAAKRKKGIKLQLQKMSYNASEVYMVFEIKNNSKIDFETDYLTICRAIGNKKRKASFQKLELKVIHKYKFPNIIKRNQSKRFVYVLPKFVLGDNEKLQFELQELKGSRSVVLKAKN